MSAVRPVLGPLARAAMRVPVGGNKRRKVLVLIAAFLDTGESSPSIRQLSERCHLDRPLVCQLVSRLARDGLIEVEWRAGPERRNIYRLPEGSP